MSKVAISEEYLTDIADSIREKLDSQDTYTVSEMSEAIDSIETGGGGLDWSAIGYSDTPTGVQEGYDYAKQIYNNWENKRSLTSKFNGDHKLTIMPMVDTSNATDMNSCFSYCYGLTSVPLLNTSNVTNMQQAFRTCYILMTIPQFNTSKVSNMKATFSGCNNLTNVPQFDTTSLTDATNIFSNCYVLSDESLNNILKMCKNATNYTATKTLAGLGLSSSYYSASKIQALPSYQDFIDAGWTIGY